MKLGASGRLFAVDRDPAAVVRRREQAFVNDARVAIVARGSFGDSADAGSASSASARGFDGMLFDLGVSSPQLDDAARGFSFMQDGPLDMRMDPQPRRERRAMAGAGHRSASSRTCCTSSARSVSRGASHAPSSSAEHEPPSKRTADLAAIVAAAVRTREPGKHPATRTFQAIRMHVNRELEELERGLCRGSAICSAPAAGWCVIAFHSLEDRTVKQFHAPARDASIRCMPACRIFRDAARPTLRLVGKAVRSRTTS